MVAANGDSVGLNNSLGERSCPGPPRAADSKCFRKTNRYLYVEDLEHAGIVAALDPIFAAYAAQRQKGERFGDFTIRAGFVAATGNGCDFHANVTKRPAAK